MSADIGFWVALAGVFIFIVVFVIFVVEDFKENHADRLQRRIKRMERKLGKLRIKLQAWSEIKALRK